LRHLVDIHALRKWVFERHHTDREKAKKFWLKGKREEAYKILQHMITAESVMFKLRARASKAGGINNISLTLLDLQDLVQKGMNESDRGWMQLEWPEVEIMHTIRLDEMKWYKIGFFSKRRRSSLINFR